MIKVKRVYENAETSDGYRILVDRVWPRGLSKEKAKADLWLRDIAPSDSLRKWFSHDPEKWNDFRKKYFQELKEKKEITKIVSEKSKSEIVTLLFGAKDKDHNQAIALKEYLESRN